MKIQKQTRTDETPGFSIEIKDSTDLGLAILIADLGDGYQPVGFCSTVNEAREIVASDMRRRMRDLDAGETPACPESYVIWARGLDGDYHTVKRLMP